MASEVNFGVAQPYASPEAHTRAQTESPADNLWRKALDSLDGDLRVGLDFKNSTKKDIITKTLSTAEEKRQLCLRKRWKLNIGSKEIILRDVLEKIIRWLNHFKALGDVAAQSDAGHAALPWAAVRFILMVSL